MWWRISTQNVIALQLRSVLQLSVERHAFKCIRVTGHNYKHRTKRASTTPRKAVVAEKRIYTDDRDILHLRALICYMEKTVQFEYCTTSQLLIRYYRTSAIQ